jgi:hypothetical protein
LAYRKIFLAFPWPEKAIPQRLWHPRRIGILRAFFRHFSVPENPIFQGTWDPLLKSAWLPVAIFHNFGALKMRFLTCREILHSRATGFMLLTVRHFGRLKMWFFKDHETLGLRLSSFYWATVQHYIGLKMRFLKHPEIFGSTLPGYRWAHIRHFRGVKSRFLVRRGNLVSGVHVLLWNPF